MDVCETKRLKQLEDENAKLKKLLAEQMLDAAALRRTSVQKMVGPVAKRGGVAHLQAVMGLFSGWRACSLVDADRKMTRYRSRRAPDTELRTQLRDLANARRRFGYRRCSSCCGRTANRPGSTASTGSIAKKGLTVRKRRGRRRAAGDACADPGSEAACSTPAGRWISSR